MVERKKSDSWEKKIEQRVRELEKKIEMVGKGMESKTIREDGHQKEHHGHIFFWGIVLIVVGIIWLGNNLEWFIYEIPWIPVIMIAGGIYIIMKNWEKKDPTDDDQTEKK